MKKSIFNQTCPEISDTFDRVPASKILIVPLDFAKSKHVALFCNGNGDQLLKPFTVHNNKEGLDYLLEQIKTTCKRLAIKPQNVIVGGEDCPTFALAMLWQIEQNTRHLVIRVNAWKAKTNRDNMQASTDKLDLLGIGKTMINREAYRVFPDSEELTQFDYGDIDGTRETSRCRDALVESRTAVTNRIHSVVKVLFPGFLTKDRSGIYPFTNACLTLMAEDDFSAACYARKKTEVLAKRLASLSLTKPHEKADEIIKLANQALSPPPAIIDARRACLQALVVTYRAISESCDSMEKTAAKALARHPGAFLSTIPGYGIITACAVSGEQGHPASMRRLSSMCSYAGIVPSVKQTGGPDSPAKTGSVKRRCNRRLKNHIVRTA